MNYTNINKPRRTDNPLYSVYLNIRKRCISKSNKDYVYYGGRGIKICDRWLGIDGFTNFINDMGERLEGMTLERINNDGDYSPDNCRWASRKEQQRNKGIANNNTSGHTGIYRYGKVWRTAIKAEGKLRFVGSFNTLEEALSARLSAEAIFWN